MCCSPAGRSRRRPRVRLAPRSPCPSTGSRDGSVLVLAVPPPPSASCGTSAVLPRSARNLSLFSYIQCLTRSSRVGRLEWGELANYWPLVSSWSKEYVRAHQSARPTHLSAVRVSPGGGKVPHCSPGRLSSQRCPCENGKLQPGPIRGWPFSPLSARSRSSPLLPQTEARVIKALQASAEHLSTRPTLMVARGQDSPATHPAPLVAPASGFDRCGYRHASHRSKRTEHCG